MPLTIEERHLTARACRALAHTLKKDSETQSWVGVREALEKDVAKLLDLAERFERGLPPIS